MTRVEQQLIESISSMSEEQRIEVLRFVQDLGRKTPRGVSGRNLIRHIHDNDIRISDEDAEEMTRAIEEGCGQIDADEW